MLLVLTRKLIRKARMLVNEDIEKKKQCMKELYLTGVFLVYLQKLNIHEKASIFRLE